MFKKDFSLKVLVVVFFIVSLSILVSGLLVLESQQGTTYERLYPSNDSGHRYIQTIDSNYTAIANGGGVKMKLFNTGTRDLFVPLKTNAEWLLFQNAAYNLGVRAHTFCGDGYCNKDYVSVNSYNTETCYNCSTDCGGCSCNSGSTCPTGEYCAGLDYYCVDYGGFYGAQCRYHSNQYNCESEYGCEWEVMGTGTCTPGACIPNCVGKVCGDDGCGGSCGASCAWNRYCSSGQCILKCGDGYCTGSEIRTIFKEA